MLTQAELRARLDVINQKKKRGMPLLAIAGLAHNEALQRAARSDKQCQRAVMGSYGHGVGP